MSSTTIKIRLPDGSQQSFAGREAWTLRRLVDAGIETIREAHGGPFSGQHARFHHHPRKGRRQVVIAIAGLELVAGGPS
jgi:hypothetical protein